MPKIKAEIQGEGFPIVFIHGFCETKEMWFPFVEGLTDSYKIICPDLPGFSESPILKEEFGLEEVAKELVGLLREQNIEQAIFIGHSLGGYVALAIAENYPEIVQGIGLINSTAFADDKEGKHRRDKAILFLQKHPVPKFIEPFIPSLFYSKRKNELAAEIQKATEIGLKSKKETIMAYTLAMKNRKDRFELWKSLPYQTLFIGGANDSRIPLAAGEQHIEEREKVDGHLIPQTAHMAMLERPSECLQMIKDYLLKVV